MIGIQIFRGTEVIYLYVILGIYACWILLRLTRPQKPPKIEVKVYVPPEHKTIICDTSSYRGDTPSLNKKLDLLKDHLNKNKLWLSYNELKQKMKEAKESWPYEE